MSEPQPAIVLVGVNHASATLTVREALSLSRSQLDELYERLARVTGLEGTVVLSTCNRIEIYACLTRSAAESKSILESLLSVVTTYPVEELRKVSYHTGGFECLRHLYRVAAGLDSEMIGETEILGQVKAAYRRADELGRANKILHRSFQKAFQAAKWARTNTGISEGQVSIGNVAVELAQRIFGDLSSSETLVIGSGEVGRDVAKAFASRGVKKICIGGRTPERAQALAEETGGDVIPFGEWPERLHSWDIVICATSARRPVLDRGTLDRAVRRRPARPLFLIDLAVPRDIEPEAGKLPNVYLYNFADLAAIANENLRHRQAAVEECRQVLDERARNLWQHLAFPTPIKSETPPSPSGSPFFNS